MYLPQPLQLHFVLTEEQLHLLQLVLQGQVLLQHVEVELRRRRAVFKTFGGNIFAPAALLFLECERVEGDTYRSEVSRRVSELTLTAETRDTLSFQRK